MVGQVLPVGKWVRSGRCESGACAEILDEGDGNLLLRSSLNRDRTLRLTTEEFDQILDMGLWPGRTSLAPELVT